MRLVQFKSRYPIGESNDVWINPDTVNAVIDGTEINEEGQRIECALIHASGFYTDVHGSASDVVAKLTNAGVRR